MAHQVDYGLRPCDVAANRTPHCFAERAGQHVRLNAKMRGRTCPFWPHKSRRVAVIDHQESVVFISQGPDLIQRREVAVHAKNAVGGDHDVACAVGAGGFELRPKIGHVGIGVTEALGLAESNPVNDRRMVQCVRNDRIFCTQKRLEHSGIGVKTGREEDRVVMAKEGREPPFKLAVDVLGAADKADRGHAVAVGVKRRFRGGNQGRMIREPEVIIGTKIDHIASADGDMATLGRRDFTLGFPKPFGLNFG